MVKKKQKQKSTSFKEALGIKNIFENDLFNFLFGVILFIIAVYLVIAFISYLTTGQADQSLVLDLRPDEWLNSKKEFQNSCGSLGALLSHFFIARCFGWAAFIIPLLVGLLGVKLMRAFQHFNLWKWFLSLAIIMIWCSVVFAKFLTPLTGDQVYNPGGDHGQFISQWLENVIGAPGLSAVLLLVAILFLTYISSETITVIRNLLNPSRYLKKVKFVITNNEKKSAANEQEESDGPLITVAGDEEEEEPNIIDLTPDEVKSKQEKEVIVEDVKPLTVSDTPEEIKDDIIPLDVQAGKEEENADAKRVNTEVDLSTPINPKEPWTKYKYPTLDLLGGNKNERLVVDNAEQQANANRIIEVLRNFGVEIKSIHATVGPTVTLYEITPAEGVRISKIRNLEDDIALSLSALGIRIIAPIPGKGTIGIEVPNTNPQIVSMRSILDTVKFKNSTMELPLALGKTITNEAFMVDLAKMPHLLVAGATGQGKSVGLNAIITSLLYKKHPNELKLVLIDPKKVEFSVYTPIVNHFMAQIPDDTGNEEAIITDVTKVIRTLNSLCKLMDHRYDLLKMAGVRNIKEYNKKYVEHKLRYTDGHEYMPYIVVIIDEFGDLIMTAGKEIEQPIARIAQLARAVGIHMVIATQRPTTKIITGNIKANFPGRIAFRVGARIDSMTILDQTGANQLIGRGDMLYCNGGEPIRVQCAFIDTPEIERINEYVEHQPGPLEPFELPEPPSEENGNGGGGNVDISNLDPMFDEAAQIIVTSQVGSTSMIQRKLSIGYNRAGRLMDQLEKAGIVGEAQGSKPRDVLIADIASLESKLRQLHSL
ncbi:MAG: DNA translocase FtsK 4TM domain-containing protein [Prevotella sp.]|nr:DNA translocase FtsK 4TM domain-containing protein [Prevotella sp.]MBP3827592.1 DNA translocase FtsK 4TM domain-containing protein [Prevotella sp.]